MLGLKLIHIRWQMASYALQICYLYFVFVRLGIVENNISTVSNNNNCGLTDNSSSCKSIVYLLEKHSPKPQYTEAIRIKASTPWCNLSMWHPCDASFVLMLSWAHQKPWNFIGHFEKQNLRIIQGQCKHIIILIVKDPLWSVVWFCSRQFLLMT